MSDPFCEPADLTPMPGAGTNAPTITVEDINIEELDVSASGLTSVRRCTEDCEPIDLVISSDENHDGGQGKDSDDGNLNVNVVGWVDAAGTYTPGTPTMTLADCATCIPICRTEYGCATFDDGGTEYVARLVETVGCAHTVTYDSALLDGSGPANKGQVTGWSEGRCPKMLNCDTP